MPSLQQDQRSTPAPLVSSCDSADPQTLRETNSRREGRRAAALAARPQLKMLLLLQHFPWKNGPGRSCANRGGGEGPLRSAPAPARPRSSAARCQRAVPRCRPGPPPQLAPPAGAARANDRRTRRGSSGLACPPAVSPARRRDRCRRRGSAAPAAAPRSDTPGRGGERWRRSEPGAAQRWGRPLCERDCRGGALTRANRDGKRWWSPARGPRLCLR